MSVDAANRATLPESGDESRRPLDEPTGSDRSDRVGRGHGEPVERLLEPGRFEARRHGAAEQLARRHHRGDEDELPDLDAEIEEQQRGRDRVMRQSDFGERSGKAEAVQEAEAEGDEPR